MSTPILESDTIQSSSQQKPYAGVIVRWAASIIDGFLSTLLSFPILIILFMLGYDQDSALVNLASTLITFGYAVFLITKYQATWGKKFFRLKVQTIDGKPMTWGRSFLREVVGKIISAVVLMLGFVWAIFDKRKQTWHDKIAGTIVVQEEPLTKGRKIVLYIIALLIPIAILGILAVVVLVAINPAEQLRRTQEAQEKSQQIQEDAQRRMDEINKMYDPQNIVETPASSY